MVDMIKFKDFVEVTTNNLREAGLSVGDRLFIAGSQSIPEMEEDPYWLRTKFLGCPVIDNHVMNEQFIMVDPRNLKKVSKTQQKKLTNILEDDFKKE